MDLGDLLTRLTIWFSLVAYTVGEAGRTGLWSTVGHRMSRLVWTAGCLLYLAHVVAAFSFYHAWSHGAASDYTARQTADVVGLDWGGGIFVNYAFTALWVAEATWWWLAPTRYLTRPPRIDRVVRAVFLFMIVNGAIVFVEGPLRWLGLGVVVTLTVAWWRARRTPGPKP